MYAASSLAYVAISAAHGGCGNAHSRPVENGAPARVWALACPPCEAFLQGDPLWSASLSEVPETHDEALAREDFEKRGAFDRDAVMAMAMAKLAGVELPDTMRRPLTGLPPHVPAGPGEVLCPAGHVNGAALRFCGECGAPLPRPAARACPDGHEVSGRMRFCGECGKPVTAALPAGVPAAAAAEPAARKGRLRDMRAEELRAAARARGIDDSGSRAQVLARLQAA